MLKRYLELIYWCWFRHARIIPLLPNVLLNGRCDVSKILPPYHPEGSAIETVLNILPSLTTSELHEVNRKLIARLRLLRRAENMVRTANFEEKDRVCFVRNGKRVFGTVIRVNPQSLTIRVDDGGSWRVSPDLLMKVYR